MYKIVITGSVHPYKEEEKRALEQKTCNNGGGCKCH